MRSPMSRPGPLATSSRCTSCGRTSASTAPSGRALRSGKRKLDVEALVRAMVFNRLCDPDSKLGCLRWLDTVAMPAMPEGVTHQHLLRAMDALMDHAERVEMELAKQIRPLVDRDLAVVFYDLTTVRIHGEGEVEDDLRAFGMNKERAASPGSSSSAWCRPPTACRSCTPSTPATSPRRRPCRACWRPSWSAFRSSASSWSPTAGC
jgi:hypothetical protein